MRDVRRFYIPNAIVFLTLVTKGRRVLFDLHHAYHVEMFFDKMRAVREFKPFKLLAYAFLPDHIHLLIQPTEEANFSSIMLSVQRSYTFEFKDRSASGSIGFGTMLSGMRRICIGISITSTGIR